jgi:DcmR-like sensory protein
MDSKQWYIPDGKVDKNRIKTQWLDLVNKCTSNGKTGLRSFCMTDTFFEHKVGEDLVNYENSLSPNFDFQFLPICAYTQGNFAQLSQRQQKVLVTSHNQVWMQTEEKTKSNQKI